MREGHDLVRVREGASAERVDHAEDRCIRADAERQDSQRRNRERRTFAKDARCLNSL
jgi:hypothetical protein